MFLIVVYNGEYNFKFDWPLFAFRAMLQLHYQCALILILYIFLAFRIQYVKKFISILSIIIVTLLGKLYPLLLSSISFVESYSFGYLHIFIQENNARVDHT
jgi:hypothetical protein